MTLSDGSKIQATITIPKPFDKVLVRDLKEYRYYQKDSCFPYRYCSGSYRCCIPYNEDTKHLIGTTEEWKGGEV